MRFQRLRGFWHIIQDKTDLDAILRPTLCCILHNLLIKHPVPPDWFNDNIVEFDQEDELNQSVEQSDAATRRNQVFAALN